MVHIGQPVDAKLDGMFLIFIRTLFIDVLYPEVGLAFLSWFLGYWGSQYEIRDPSEVRPGQ